VTTEELAHFEANRGRLFGLAYRMLGDAAEAEDAVQDAFLRWAARGAADEPVATPAAWLTTVVTNLCLNRLTSAKARREQYIGEWLPTPVFTAADELGPLETLEQRESVSMAVLVLLERLTPAERAAFVLHEAFGYSHRDVADILHAEEAHVRQLYRRARTHVGSARKRFAAEPARQEQIVRRFLAAALDGNLAELEQLLAADVTSRADGGGKAAAVRQPVTGRAKVARLYLGLARHPRAAAAELRLGWVNGQPALVVREGGALTVVTVVEVADDQIVGLHVIANPDKLAYAARQRVS
jgi:RNA polymerase sigma-70 factor (ECF subfamily)